MSESQSRRVARAFEVLERASKAFAGKGARGPEQQEAERASAPEPREPTEPRGRRRARGRGGSDDSGSGKGGSGNGTADGSDRVSPSALEQAALRYLNRYDASVEQLRRVLFRHVARHVTGALRERAERDVRTLLERYQVSRLLDDARYAEALARGLRARGTSSLGIRHKLRARGVDEELVVAALDKLGAEQREGEDPELTAARAYARKRRLKSRYDLSVPAERQKALAALARKGFSFSIAQRALSAEDDGDGRSF